MNELNNSRLFDPYRWSTAAQVDNACDDLMHILGFKDVRYAPYIRMVLLDLYCAWRSDPAQYISYSRDNKRYGSRSRYTRIKVGLTGLTGVIDALKREGFVEHVNAVCYRDPVTNKPYAGYSSRIRATKMLIRFIVKHGIKLSMISRHPNEAVIQLRSETSDGVTVQMKFDSMPRDVARSEKVLFAYNQLLQRTYIDVADDFLTVTEKQQMRRGNKTRCDVNLSKKRVYRVFNENWKQNGRIYGAWWHSCPKQLRKHIVIDGEPTIEFDFSSIHILLLYAHLGINFLDEREDAYTTEGNDFRKAMKVVLMSAINAKPDDKFTGEQKAIKAAWETLVKKCNTERKQQNINSHEKLYSMLEALKERHKPIADFLSSGKGIELMKQDSDIAVELIKQHIKMNVPILTVHDSFIVPVSFAQFTIDLMNQAYGKQVADLLGADYKSTIETIDCLNNTISREDTSQNINVEGLIKSSISNDEFQSYITKWKSRITSNQIRRFLYWRNNKYQFNKVSILL